MTNEIHTEKEQALDFNKPFGLNPETKEWLRKVVEKIEEEMMANKMTNEQIIQLAEHFGIHMQTRPYGLVQHSDGVMSFRKRELHYAGEQIIELVRIMEGVNKRKFNSKPTLHKIIREYEKYGMTASEMIGRIMLLEGITDKDL